MRAAVVLAFMAPFAVTSAVDPGRYTGQNRGGVEMRLRLMTNQRLDYRLGYRYRCNDGNHTRGATSPRRPPRLRSDGTFRYRETGSSRNRAFGRYRYRERIAGRLTATRAKGSYEGILIYRSGRVCKARAGWSAKRR